MRPADGTGSIPQKPSIGAVSAAIGAVMVRQGEGRMVNIASMMGHTASTNSAAYTASKHAVVGLTKVLALEWAAAGVRVNALCPGYTRSALTEPWMSNRAVASAREAQTPLGRFADPWEMVGPSLFMVSDASTCSRQETSEPRAVSAR